MDYQGERFPKSVFSYYVQLYCKKSQIKRSKSNPNNLIREATRSWLNLSSSKRKLFTAKYDNCHLKLRKCFADKLKNAIPFSNKSQIEEINTKEVCCISRSNSLNDVSSIQTGIEVSQDIDTATTSLYLDNPEQINESNQDQQKLSEFPHASIHEPCPPKFRTLRELYNIINRNSDAIPWEELTNSQRAQYSEAGIRIKRLYLMEYTNYLESLPIADLHALHKKNIII